MVQIRDAPNLQFHYPPRPAATPCPTTTTRKLILAEPNPQKTRNFKNLPLQGKNTAGSMLELYKPYLLHCCAEKDSQTNSKDLKLLCYVLRKCTLVRGSWGNAEYFFSDARSTQGRQHKLFLLASFERPVFCLSNIPGAFDEFAYR